MFVGEGDDVLSYPQLLMVSWNLMPATSTRSPFFRPTTNVIIINLFIKGPTFKEEVIPLPKDFAFFKDEGHSEFGFYCVFFR